MRRGNCSSTILAASAAAALLLAPAVAGAVQPRDYFLDPPTPGTFAHLDAYTVGAQTSLEYRAHLEEGMSMFHFRASGIMSLPYAESSVNVDTRVFLFTLGGSAAYRHVYRNHTFEPGEDASWQARKDREEDKDWDSQSYEWYEGRLRMTIPLDSFFMVNTGTIRYENGQDRSFDWFHVNVHDAGTLYKFDSVLFFRHRDFGAIGPSFRYLSSPKTDANGVQKRDGEIAYGLTFGTRPGLVSKRGGNTDLALVNMLFSFGDDEFGFHGYPIPWYLLAVYRASLKL